MRTPSGGWERRSPGGQWHEHRHGQHHPRGAADAPSQQLCSQENGPADQVRQCEEAHPQDGPDPVQKRPRKLASWPVPTGTGMEKASQLARMNSMLSRNCRSNGERRSEARSHGQGSAVLAGKEPAVAGVQVLPRRLELQRRLDEQRLRFVRFLAVNPQRRGQTIRRGFQPQRRAPGRTGYTPAAAGRSPGADAVPECTVD